MAKAKTTKKATKTVAKVEAKTTTNNKGTLVPNMFIKEHTYKTGTTVTNVSIKLPDFVNFCRENMRKTEKGDYFINFKFIPNKNVGENKLSHTPILDEYWHKDVNNLANDVFESSQEDMEKENRKQKDAVGDELPF